MSERAWDVRPDGRPLVRRRPPWRRPLEIILGLLVLVVLLRTFVVDVYRVDSVSMEPTIHAPERVLVSYVNGGAPARFELLILLRGGEQEAAVKRAAALSGESVEIRGGDLVIDGARLAADAPRPPPIAVFDQRYQTFAGAFADSAPDGGFVGGFEDRGEIWRLDASAAPPGAKRGFEYARELTDDYLAPDHTLVVGELAVNDALVECELQVEAPRSGDGRGGVVGWSLSEQGDRFDVELEIGDSGRATARLWRGGESGVGELLAEREVAWEPGAWHRLVFSNVDNHLALELDGRARVLAHSYDANRPPPVDGPEHLRPRVAFRARGLVCLLRRVRVLRDLYYTQDGRHGTRSPLQLGPDEIFVLGDNSAKSQDGRTWGAVPMSAILGRPLWVVWPPAQIRSLSRAGARGVEDAEE